MKNISTKKMITKKQERLIIVGKEQVVDGKKEFRCNLKASCINSLNRNSDTKHNLNNSEIRKLITLSKNNPREYISKLIDLNFAGDLINREATGTGYLLPFGFEKSHKKCVHFAGSKYEVYFVDETIKYLSDKISQLKSRRIDDSHTYAIKAIESGKVKNLKFRFSDGFSWDKETYCLYDENNENYCMETEPEHVLYYKIGLDDEKKVNPTDTKNIIDIIDKFVLVRGPIKHVFSSPKELITSSYDDVDSAIKIDGLDNAPVEVIEKVLSLRGRN